jgi:hypothetical protein
MNPALLPALAAEHRRDLDPGVTAHRAPGATVSRRARPLSVPRFRVSLTRTSLAAVAGSRRGKSLVIVISATRTL